MACVSDGRRWQQWGYSCITLAIVVGPTGLLLASRDASTLAVDTTLDLAMLLLVGWLIAFLAEWPWWWLDTIRSASHHAASLHASLHASLAGSAKPPLCTAARNLQRLRHWSHTLVAARVVATVLCAAGPAAGVWLMTVARRQLVWGVSLVWPAVTEPRRQAFSDFSIAMFVMWRVFRAVVYLAGALEERTRVPFVPSVLPEPVGAMPRPAKTLPALHPKVHPKFPAVVLRQLPVFSRRLSLSASPVLASLRPVPVSRLASSGTPPHPPRLRVLLPASPTPMLSLPLRSLRLLRPLLPRMLLAGANRFPQIMSPIKEGSIERTPAPVSGDIISLREPSPFEDPSSHRGGDTTSHGTPDTTTPRCTPVSPGSTPASAAGARTSTAAGHGLVLYSLHGYPFLSALSTIFTRSNSVESIRAIDEQYNERHRDSDLDLDTMVPEEKPLRRVLPLPQCLPLPQRLPRVYSHRLRRGWHVVAHAAGAMVARMVPWIPSEITVLGLTVGGLLATSGLVGVHPLSTPTGYDVRELVAEMVLALVAKVDAFAALPWRRQLHLVAVSLPKRVVAAWLALFLLWPALVYRYMVLPLADALLARRASAGALGDAALLLGLASPAVEWRTIAPHKRDPRRFSSENVATARHYYYDEHV